MGKYFKSIKGAWLQEKSFDHNQNKQVYLLSDKKAKIEIWLEYVERN